MALYGEDFRRCPNCGHYEFVEKKLVIVAKEGVPIPTWAQRRETGPNSYVSVTQERHVYSCAQCGRELDAS